MLLMAAFVVAVLNLYYRLLVPLAEHAQRVTRRYLRSRAPVRGMNRVISWMHVAS